MIDSNGAWVNKAERGSESVSRLVSSQDLSASLLESERIVLLEGIFVSPSCHSSNSPKTTDALINFFELEPKV